MPAHRYLEENSSAAMLAARKSAGVAPEVHHRAHVTCMPLSIVNKAAHSGIEKQRRHHQKTKTGVSIGPTERTCVLQKDFLKNPWQTSK